MRFRLSVVLFIFSVLYVKAEPNDFFVIPVKSIRFINKATKQNLSITSYSLVLEMRFNCLDPECRSFNGNNTSNSEVSVSNGNILKTLATKIPRMPNAGPLMLTFSFPGICKNRDKCSVSMSYDHFVRAAEPVTFAFEYDEQASKVERKNRLESEARSFAEIEEKMGKKRQVSSLTVQGDKWKQLETDFIENRKKLTPMSYSAASLEKLGLNPWLCGQNLQKKIEKCEFHVCIYQSGDKTEKLVSDLIVHGFNNAGNCAISTPGGKRFFVPKEDLVYFYEAFTSSSTLAAGLVNPCQDQTQMAVCREKKKDLLYQLSIRHLVTDFTPIKMGNLAEK